MLGLFSVAPQKVRCYPVPWSLGVGAWMYGWMLGWMKKSWFSSWRHATLDSGVDQEWGWNVWSPGECLGQWWIRFLVSKGWYTKTRNLRALRMTPEASNGTWQLFPKERTTNPMKMSSMFTSGKRCQESIAMIICLGSLWWKLRGIHTLPNEWFKSSPSLQGVWRVLPHHEPACQEAWKSSSTMTSLQDFQLTDRWTRGKRSNSL